jgi:hypothetical protein
MAHPLDEYPIHQVARSMAHVGTSDRDFYDRNIFHVIPHGQLDLQFIAGFGVYPNLGVRDAYTCVRVGDVQHVVRASDAMDDDRMRMEVGPIRIEVVEPLHKVRVVCEGDGDEVSCDLVWTAAVPVHDEAHHELWRGTKAVLDASRFLGIGTWEGELGAGGERWEITPEDFTATRDRSWGIRPVGEAVPPGRWAAELEPTLYWFWIPLRFEEFSTIVILQEEPDGTRTLNDAVRMHPDGRTDQLGWPRVDVRYRSGTRLPEGATVHLTGRDGTPLTIEIEVLGSMPLHVGCGYGGDPDWSHGQWRGREWCERVVYDLTDPAIVGRTPFGVIDHAARARCGDAVGYGIFEHGTVGRHDPSGFTDLMSVAP